MASMKMSAKKIAASDKKMSVSATLLIAAIAGGLLALWVTFQPLAIQ